MSGKGKGKKKGTGFRYKNVDLTRFAYDVIRYTALKFQVPESTIAVMEGSSNDYEHDDYLSVVCGQIIGSQIVLRYRINKFFREHFETNRLASPELIGELIQEVMETTITKLELRLIPVVIASLAAVCELFLFLYSKNADLCPVELATFWIQHYLNHNKKKFVDTGGLKELYNHCRSINLNNMDAFLNSFIDEYCVSYENSSKSETLELIYGKKLLNEIRRGYLSSKDDKEIEAANLNDQIMHLNIGDAVVVQPPHPDGASGGNETQNTGLRIILPDKVLKLPSPLVTSSQDPSAATPEEQQWYKYVDLARFAYNVIRYTALKFRVPENTIAVMEGSSNDYGHDDYLSVVCGQIIGSQIVLRYRINMIFREHFETNRLASPELIGELIQEVMETTIRKLELRLIPVVIASLAAVCELFLFLYSKNADLCPVELATFWIQHYLNLNKKKFVDTGGLKELYNHSRSLNLDNMDAFLNSFIDEHCVSYENSSKSETLELIYAKKLLKENRRKSLSSKDEKEIEIANLNDQIMHLNIGQAVVVQSPQPDGVSGGNETQNTGLGITPPDEVLKLPSPSGTSSQDPTAATPEEQQRYRRYLTPNERSEMINSCLRATIQRSLGQLSSYSLLRRRHSPMFRS